MCSADAPCSPHGWGLPNGTELSRHRFAPRALVCLRRRPYTKHSWPALAVEHAALPANHDNRTRASLGGAVGGRLQRVVGQPIVWRLSSFDVMAKPVRKGFPTDVA